MAVDKLDFMIFEKDPDVYGRIRDEIIGYSVRKNMEADIYWLREENQLTDVASLAKKVHIAFVNSDYARLSLTVSQTVFKSDESVLIVFYGSNTVDFKPYFSSRPIVYMDPENESFESVINNLRSFICERRNVFVWVNKNVRLFISHSRIVYLQSYKGYVDVITTDGSSYHILGKLDAAEAKLNDENFIRVHQSSIVNLRQVRSMDRTNKCFTMSDSAKVYISKAYYKAVSDCFANYNLIK